MIRCIDIADNKNLSLSTVSPIAMGAWMILFFAINLLVKSILLYIICTLLAFVFTQIFFQFGSRYVILAIKFLTRAAYLTPSFEDYDYDPDLERYPEVAKVLAKK